MDIARIVEFQATLSSYRATENYERAAQLELLIEMTKPKNDYEEWHPFISAPFRYNPPHPEARFRPAYGRNVFYGAVSEETLMYEHAYHFMKQRMHLRMKTETGMRTLFFVKANNKNSIDIRHQKNFSAIMDKKNYLASHQYILANPKAFFIVYPSCRDPKGRDNVAILDIHLLDKHPKHEAMIKFFYDNAKKQISWLDYQCHIQWSDLL